MSTQSDSWSVWWECAFFSEYGHILYLYSFICLLCASLPASSFFLLGRDIMTKAPLATFHLRQLREWKLCQERSKLLEGAGVSNGHGHPLSALNLLSFRHFTYMRKTDPYVFKPPLLLGLCYYQLNTVSNWYKASHGNMMSYYEAWLNKRCGIQGRVY